MQTPNFRKGEYKKVKQDRDLVKTPTKGLGFFSIHYLYALVDIPGLVDESDRDEFTWFLEVIESAFGCYMEKNPDLMKRVFGRNIIYMDMSTQGLRLSTSISGDMGGTVIPWEDVIDASNPCEIGRCLLTFTRLHVYHVTVVNEEVTCGINAFRLKIDDGIYTMLRELGGM